MKKADIEKKITKSMIITGIVLVVMFCMVLIENEYNNKIGIPPVVQIGDRYEPVINIVTLVISIALLGASAICVFLGFKKNQKFFEASAWCAGLATLTMLIKISHEARPIISIANSALNNKCKPLIGINWAYGQITIYEIAQLAFALYLIGLWIHTIYCINKK